MGVVFHIDSIEEFIDESGGITIWNVKITLIADDDPQSLRLRRTIMKQ